MSDTLTKDRTISNLYAEFSRQNTKGEYEKALKTLNKILQLDNDDVTAFECKIIILIQLNRFEDVLQQIKRFTHLSNNLIFEHAYALYRTNRPDESLKLLDAVQTLDQRLSELKAQVLYRLERFEEGMNVYNNIIRNYPSDEFEDERRANLAAVAAYLPNAVELYTEQLVEETYEQCYNKALVYAINNSYNDAEKFLKKAEKLLKEFYEEDGSSEEEIEAEMAHIRILQAYCCQHQGRVKEAHQLYVASLQLKLDDAALVAIASNNVVVINKDKNVFDSKKKMKSAMMDSAMSKLPVETKKTIHLNNAIFNYYANQHDQSNKLCNSIIKEWPDLEVRTKILNVLNSRKLNSKSDSMKMLKDIKAQTKDDDLFLKLTCAHLLLSNGDKEDACKVLADLGDYTYQPGIVGALITIYSNLGKEKAAVDIYEKAIEWHKLKEKTSKDMENFYKQAAEFHSRNGRPEVAAKSLEQLRIICPDDKKIVAQLIMAYAQFKPVEATKLCLMLGSISEYKNEVDVANLESNNWLTTKKSATTPRAELSPGTDTDGKKKRANRKKKGKMPKNYDASQAPDPERWLPKYERTGFRKKRDRRMKDIIKGSQGTTAGQAEQFDFSSKHTADGDDSPTSVEPSPLQRNAKQQQKKGNAKKKGGKRRH